jgi:predicted N-formylglutamate amidohydrolase
MGPLTYEQLLERLIEVRNDEYRSDLERETAWLDVVVDTLQVMLEKLRDAED